MIRKGSFVISVVINVRSGVRPGPFIIREELCLPPRTWILLLWLNRKLGIVLHFQRMKMAITTIMIVMKTMGMIMTIIVDDDDN